MQLIENIALKLLHKLDPEFGHKLAISALKMGLVAKHPSETTQRLKVNLAGLDLPNPVGLAAGFDKNATAIAPLLGTGFGFIEVGAATPLPQPGNPKPRLFRLTQDRASINRFGFNNEGMDVIASRLAKRPKTGVVGINLGANKTSTDRAADYVKVLKTCAKHVDFATINVSSPNTESLRDLQGEKALDALLENMIEARSELDRAIPIFLKIAPDLETDEIAQISRVALKHKIDAIIATNTTLARHNLKSKHAHEAGGLAGEPLFEKSTRVLAQLAKETKGEIALVGVGGISSAQHALAKIKAGATAVQLYTSLVYHGFSLVPNINKDLDALLSAQNFKSINDAVGTDIGAYL